jgi:hypothetical protein
MHRRFHCVPPVLCSGVAMTTDYGRNPYLFHEPIENTTAEFIRIANTAHDAGLLDLETGQKAADIFHGREILSLESWAEPKRSTARRAYVL